MMHYFCTKIIYFPIPNYRATKMIANSIKQAVWHVKPSLECSMAVTHTIVFMGFCLSAVWRNSSSCCSDWINCQRLLFYYLFSIPIEWNIFYIYIYIYVWKLNQTVLELDFRAVKFLFFPRRDLNPHHCYTAAPFA